MHLIVKILSPKNIKVNKMFISFTFMLINKPNYGPKMKETESWRKPAIIEYKGEFLTVAAIMKL